MPALHAKTHPLVVANARHSRAMAVLCAWIGHVLTRLSGTLEKLSTSAPSTSTHCRSPRAMEALPERVDHATLADFMRALEHARSAALVQADAERLLHLHADDYQLITPSGRSFTRDRYLGLLASADLRYLRWEPDAMHVLGSDTLAVVRYTVTLQLGSPAGPGTPQRCWHTDAYQLCAGRWQAVWSQATKILP